MSPGRRQVVPLNLRLRLFQRPGDMVQVHPDGLSGPVRAENAGSLHQKILECPAAALGQPPRRTQPPVARHEQDRLACEPSPAIKQKLPLRPLLQPHLGPVIRQAIEGAPHSHGQQVVGLQREKTHARRSRLVVANVGAQAQLRKAARPRNRRHAPELDPVHPERHHPQPRGPLERVHLQALGHQRRNRRRRNWPVRKQQIVPALGHHPAARWQGPRPVRCAYQVLQHGPVAPVLARSLKRGGLPASNRTPMPYSVREPSSMSSETFTSPGARNQTEVFAVHGADPEVLAYAMAKYSRSALSMRESLNEISAQRAEQFLNTFYFQYGHRSIADLAHIAFAVERLSLLAAIVLVDEQRWDGQERSTRYQNFLKSGFYLPDFGEDAGSAELYSQTVENLFSAYQRTNAAVLDLLRQRIACPE